MNLIQEDKDAILESNQKAKSAMIVAVLNEEQKVKERKVRKGKSEG